MSSDTYAKPITVEGFETQTKRNRSDGCLVMKDGLRSSTRSDDSTKSITIVNMSTNSSNKVQELRMATVTSRPCYLQKKISPRRKRSKYKCKRRPAMLFESGVSATYQEEDRAYDRGQKNAEFSIHNWTLAEVKDADKIKLRQLFKEMKRKRRLKRHQNRNQNETKGGLTAR